MSRGFSAVGLHLAKNSRNVGGAMRAAQCYGANLLAVSGGRYQKNAADTTKAYRHIPLLQVKDLHEVVPYDCVPVAVEIREGAMNLINYVHPERAFYVFGPEDSSLGKSVLSWCRDTIYVPTDYCMNLAATVNVILYDRMAKHGRKMKEGGIRQGGNR